MPLKLPKSNLIDALVAYVDPQAGVRRAQSRATLSMSSVMFGESSGYMTAGSNRRSLRGWVTRLLSPDGDTIPKLKDARASSRDLYMNTALASAALKRISTNVIGHGLTLQSRIEREALGLTNEEADAWERNVEMLFRVFSSSKNCDMTRGMSFAQLQSLAFMSPLLSGDLFFMLPWKKVTGWPFELRIKLIEADLCSNPDDVIDSETCAAGIELDEDGAPKRYHFANKFPLGTDLFNATQRIWTPFDAFDPISGRQNVFHIFEKERPGQRRGMPFLSPVFEVLKQLSRLTEAKLMQNLIQTFFTVFVKDQSGPASLAPNFGTQTTVVDPDEPDADVNYELGNASVVELDSKKDITVADPSRTDTGFQAFFESIVKQLGASCEIPFEQLLLHFSASYSASRAALLEAWKFYRKRRANFAVEFCQPVYEAFLFEMVYKGYIKAPGFLENPIIRQFWCKAKWGGSGQGQIDPLKETTAALDKIAGNLSNHEDEFTLMYGGDWESTFMRNVRETELIRSNGMKPISEQNTKSSTSTPQAPDDEKSNKEESK